MGDDNTVNEEAAAGGLEQQPPKVYTLPEAMKEISTVIEAFSVMDMVTASAALRFQDPANVECFVNVSMYRVNKVPQIDVASGYGDDVKAQAEDYKVMVTEGIEALAARIKARYEAAQEAAQDDNKTEGEGRLIQVG